MSQNEKALDNVQRYRHRNGDGAMVPKGDGPWVLRDDVLTALESQPVAGQVGEAYDGSTGHDSWCRSIPQVIRGIVQTGPCNCSLRTVTGD